MDIAFLFQRLEMLSMLHPFGCYRSRLSGTKYYSLKRRSLPPLTALARPELKLAGVRIDGNLIHGVECESFYTGSGINQIMDDAYIIRSETSEPATHVYHYHSGGWLRECAKWDQLNRRFIVSFFEGGLGVVLVDQDHAPGSVLDEVVVVENTDLGKNSSLGLVVDRPRNRVVVAIADVFGNRYSALAAYDLTTWRRIFLTQLSGPEGEKTFANDVAIDPEGNAYVTDSSGSKIWKVGVNGEFLYTIKSPLFAQKEWYKKLIGLNGIVYHPNGYLLVIHTFSGNLFKIEIGKEDEVKLVNIIGGSLRIGDGLELVSSTKLVVAGNPSKLLESSDDWETAGVVGKFSGATHRLVTAATMKDDKVYLNHIFGLGYPKRKHVLIEADFSS